METWITPAGRKIENTSNCIDKNNEIMRTKMTDGKLPLVRVEEKAKDKKYYKYYMHSML